MLSRLPLILTLLALAAPVAAEALPAHRSLRVYGVPSLTLDASIKRYALGPYMEILEDPRREWSIQDVSSPAFNPRFVPAADTVPNYGYSSSAYWVRLRLSRTGEAPLVWLLENAYVSMDSMTFYRQRGGAWESREVGDAVPFHAREVPHRTAVLRLHLANEAHASEEFYFRFVTEGSVQIDLRLWAPEVFAESALYEQYGFGLYYGLFGAMIVYNFFLFFAVGDRSYLYYVFYTISFGLMMMTLNGLAFQFLWPGWPQWSNHALLFFFCATVFGGVLFSRNFLETWKFVPRLDLLLQFLIGFAPVFAFASLFFTYSNAVRLVVVLSLVTCVAVVLSGFLAYVRGFDPARFYLLAWMGPMAGGILFTMRNMDLLPSMFLTDHGLQIGSAVEVLLLSLALGDRINVLRRQHHEVSRALNESLEEQVGERTRELNEALRELRRTHEELIDKDRVIQEELNIAAKIQRGILPPAETRWAGVRILSHYESIEKIGGDFFDIEPLDDGRLALLIADVSGHGIPAALLTTMAKIVFAEALERHTSPAEILSFLNESMRRTVKTEEFLTAFCVRIDRDYRVTYSSAGHHHGFLLRRSQHQADRMETGGVVLGLIESSAVRFEDKTDRLAVGDRMFLFTDGIVEATNDRMEVFGRRRLYEALMESLGLSLEEQKLWVLREWRSFVGAAPVQDDVSFLLLEVDGNSLES